MRMDVAGLTVALFVSGTLVAAQDAKVTTDTKVKSDDGKVVTMIGCVEIGGGTSYVLTNITSDHVQHDAKSHDATPSAPAGPYALVERKGLDLGSFIQQKVELTGVIVPAASGGDKN